MGDASGIIDASGTDWPTVTANFTKFFAADDKADFLAANSLYANANSCEFWAGAIGGYNNVNGLNLNLFNCLLNGSTTTLRSISTSPAFSLQWQNCTQIGGQLAIYRANSAWPITIRDSAFDGVNNSFSDSWPGQGTSCDYNARSQSPPWNLPSGMNDLSSISSFNWQGGPLGNFYLPSGSQIIDHDTSTTADKVGNTFSARGLYDFTTLAAFSVPGNPATEAREGTSPVDTGYHYVAVDANTNPICSDGSGIPDYWKDMYGLAVGVSDGLHGPNADPDGDGLSNLQEYQLGSDPLRPNSQNLVISGQTYKQILSPSLAATGKPFDIYYRPNPSAQWRRISGGIPGQKTFTFVHPNPASEGDYIFLDAEDTDGDGLSDGYEDWFTYTPGSGIQSHCAPRSVHLTCTNQPDSDFDTLFDGWKVAHGLNPMESGGSTDPNDPNYVLPGDTLNNYQKQTDYYAKVNNSQPNYADYDPLNITASPSVRPVVTIAQSAASAFNTTTFTISRDVGSTGSTASALTVYYAVGGELTYGKDYTLDPPPISANYPAFFSVQIPQNQTSVTVTITVTPGAVPANNLVVTLVPYGSVQ